MNVLGNFLKYEMNKKAKYFVLLFLLAVLNSTFGAGIKLPEPTGTYPVGTTVFSLTDENRMEIYTDDPADHRSLLIRAWYPAQPAGNEEKAGYWADPAAVRRSLGKQMGVPAFLFYKASKITTHSFLNAPVSGLQSSFPVLIFSHGYTGLETQNTVLMEDLASHGYIVFSISHTYEAVVTLFPDGKKASIFQRKPEIGDGWDGDYKLYEQKTEDFNLEENPALIQKVLELLPTINQSMRIWSDDISFVVDELEKLNTNGDVPLFAGKLDLERLGAFGHSFGGAASGQFSVQDDRCKAAINMDGLQWGGLFEKKLTKPLMMMYSDHNIGDMKPQHDVIYSGSGETVYSVYIKGSFHNDYSDFTLLNLFKKFKVLGPIEGRRMVDITRRYTLAFFNTHVKGEPDALLNSPSSNYPEVTFSFKNADSTE